MALLLGCKPLAGVVLAVLARQSHHKKPHNATQEMEVRGVNKERTWSMHVGSYRSRASGGEKACCLMFLLLADGHKRERKSDCWG